MIQSLYRYEKRRSEYENRRYSTQKPIEYSLSAIKWPANYKCRSKIPSHSVYKMGRSSNLTSEQQMVIKALSTTKKTQGKIQDKQAILSAVSKCLQGKSWMQEMWPRTCYH